MIADPEGPSFIARTVGHRQYSDGAFVTHDPELLVSRPPHRVPNGSRLAGG
jgi:hypothetical protein